MKAETKTEKKEEKENVQYSEFASGSLFRSIRFPKKVNADSVKAENQERPADDYRAYR